MFGASETRYDLRFQALGIPVRIHPFFWVVSFILGFHDGVANNIPLALLFVVCAFLSIVVHEFGHGLVAKAQGFRPTEILLYAFGGLCSYHADRQRPGQRLAVLIWGPGAGFVLAGLLMIVYSVAFGLTAEEHLAVVQQFFGRRTDLTSVLDKLGYVFRPDALNLRFEFYWDMLWINIMWGLVNLLPIWPLDGGQITLTVLSQISPYDGRRWMHIVSLVASALIAIMLYAMTQDLRRCIMFGYVAVINYQMLDMIHRAQSMGTYDDDWWRK
jgi:stage IV sporulation protein FB